MNTIDWSQQRVIITGGAGFLGRCLVRRLNDRGVTNDRIFIPRRRDFDLTTEAASARLYRQAFAADKATMCIHLAAEVGGIGANRLNPGRFFFANMAMALHLIEQARLDGFPSRDGRFVQVGSICSYPKHTPVPFNEEAVWDGYPEETNAPYGIAKKSAGVMLDAYCRQYAMRGAYVMPVNLYGPDDHFDLENSHVIPALIRKCVEARQRGDDHIVCWGTGSASREFLYVEDAAEGIACAAERMDEPVPINLGAGFEITIKDLIELIVRLTRFEGEIRWDTSKPDGQPRRSLDTRRAKELIGFEAKVGFEEGLRRTIDWFETTLAEGGEIMD